MPIKPDISPKSLRQANAAEKLKLLNIMYNEGTYYLSEPNRDKFIMRDPDLIIEKHCWYIIKFFEQKRT